MPSYPKTRSRSRKLRRDAWRYGSGPVDGFTTGGVLEVLGTQVTTSEGHPFSLLGKTDGDIGGNFYTTRNGFEDGRSLEGNPQPQYRLHYRSPTGNFQNYFGPLYAAVPSGFTTSQTAYAPSSPSSDAQMDSYGATAIARCSPTKTPAQLSVAMAELIREGIPSMIGHSLWESRLRDIRASGDEYLNLVFGWQPLINDIKNTASALKRWDTLVSQYERDSGRKVRRTYEFPIERSESTILDTSYTGADIGLTSPVISSIGPYWALNNTTFTPDRGFFNSLPRKRYASRKIETRRWFTGSFTYYLPSDWYARNEMRRIAARAEALLGLELTPEVVWNLAPWSWAVDWVSNTGDVLANISSMAQDGLVVNYGYVMEHKTITDTYTIPGVSIAGGPTIDVTSTFVTETKKRRKATPFGFGLDWGSFSPRQLSILAALGISRLP